MEISAPTGRRPPGGASSPAPARQHPSLGRVHLRDRVPADVARRRAVRHQLHAVADDEFRPDVEGLRARRRGRCRAVPLTSRCVPGWLRRRRRVLRSLRIPDHPPADQRAGLDGHVVASRFLGQASAPAASRRRVSSSSSPCWRERSMLSPLGPAHARRRRDGGGRLRRQLRVRWTPRRLLRRPARRGPAVGVAALLVARRGGAVLPSVATRARGC